MIASTAPSALAMLASLIAPPLQTAVGPRSMKTAIRAARFPRLMRMAIHLPTTPEITTALLAAVSVLMGTTAATLIHQAVILTAGIHFNTESTTGMLIRVGQRTRSTLTR